MLFASLQDMSWTLWDRWVLEGDLTVQQVSSALVKRRKVIVTDFDCDCGWPNSL